MSRPATGSIAAICLRRSIRHFPRQISTSCETRVAAFDATINRLRAELAGQDYAVGDSANADDLLQRKIFLQRKSSYDAQMQNLTRKSRRHRPI